MNDSAQRVAEFLRTRPELADYTVRIEENELHLSKGSDSFVRLIPTEKQGTWRLEHFRNRERWEHVDMTGTLAECLDYLSGNLHYLFWEG